jgi:hypothetical protein
MIHKVLATIRSLTVSSFDLSGNVIVVRWLGIFKKKIAISSLAECEIRSWAHRFSIKGETAEDYNWTRVFLYSTSGYAISLKVRDVNSFVECLRVHAPSLRIRELPTIHREVTLGR